MIAWAIALVVWIAAGARLGRVVARAATPLRTAMVIVGFCVALMATVLVPGVWDIVERVAPDQHFSAMVVVVLWVFLSAASAVGAVSAWPVMTRSAMRGIAIVLYTVGLLVSIAVGFGYPIPALVFVTIALSLVISTGLRHVAWAPLGRGIALIVLGSTTLLIVVVVMLVEAIRGTNSLESGIWTGTGVGFVSAASVFIALGITWVLAETWVRARLDLMRLRRMHELLVKRFPEVVDADSAATTSVLRASDVIAQIMDAMYIQAGAGMFDVGGREPPRSIASHSGILAGWIEDPLGSDVLDTRWIAPPGGMSARRWVLVVARDHEKFRSDVNTTKAGR
ncbi:hypothetical protein [Rhodococcus sp. IEGM 1379]|uniref:hypothetical protein n=1 Tax=Rhodococcus sp. IEGM 1379 TaxID=3047086 RepID=UPI0024B8009B|nr:hypothetical protein [Rhodococcus sp. IEGM 1379]MDI9916631.1 hypothetical protein [Rhodococcus sp. IEGM 1379]